MTSTIRQTLELGNLYASNALWSNAAGMYRRALEELYSSVAPGALLHYVPDLEDALRELGDDAVSVADTPARLKPKLRERLNERLLKRLNALRDAQEQAHQGLEFPPFMSAFRQVPSNRWTIVYHNQKTLGEGDRAVKLPNGTPVVFVLDIDIKQEQLRSAPLSAAKCAQLSYALSHIAWTEVTIAQQIYTVNKVLDRVLASEVMKEKAHNYHRALLLKPKSSWALAHYGEVYRNIANGWPPSRKSMGTPDDRVEDYITAMLYFEEAIQWEPTDFWAHAHFGAAIVNVRAFTGAVSGIPRLQELLKSWFPTVPSNEWENKFLNKAMASLIEAQQLRGGFYPWAQLYAANVLLIKSIIPPKEEDLEQANEIGALGMAMTLDAMVLQPALAGGLSEPAELYDNPFYQVALICFWTKQYPRAWRHARLGCHRSFKSLVPGVQSLCGYQLLVNISAECIKDAKLAECKDAKLAGFGDFANLQSVPVPIPVKPIGDKGELLKFIKDIFLQLCVPTVSPLMGKEVKLNTTIAVSLVQICFILYNFLNIIHDLFGEDTDGSSAVSVELMEQVTLILKALNMQIKEGCMKDYKHYQNDIATLIYTNGMSYHMGSMLEVDQNPTD